MTPTIAGCTYSGMRRDWRAVWRWRRSVVALAFALPLVTGGCGLWDEPPAVSPTPAHSNALLNPGFEEGSSQWETSPREDWQLYAIADGVAHSGQHSLQLSLAGGLPQHVAGGVQILRGAPLPEFLSGFYRVDGWQRGDPPRYVQFEVITHGPDAPDGLTDHTLRFVIGGLDASVSDPPGTATVFLRRGDPATRWTYFAYPIASVFEQRFGAPPQSFDSIELSFEARFDAPPGSGAASGMTAYFDDLYAGPQYGNPNRPND